MSSFIKCRTISCYNKVEMHPFAQNTVFSQHDIGRKEHCWNDIPTTLELVRLSYRHKKNIFTYFTLWVFKVRTRGRSSNQMTGSCQIVR